MTEIQVNNILYVLAGILGLGMTVLGSLIVWGVQKGVVALFTTVVELKLLKQELHDIKGYLGRIVQNEKDINEAFHKIRALQIGHDKEEDD